ncbi:hypothetical protein M0805_004975 [Coniferiporia weirii]|nr:hypothetical protein M0805_004975 [Coniferiporia weirii]
MFPALSSALQLLLVPLLLLRHPQSTEELPGPNSAPSLTFSLRHQHAVANGSRVLFTNVSPSLVDTQHTLKLRNTQTSRPRSLDAFSAARVRMQSNMETDANLWTKSIVPAPNVEDRETLLTLAKMTNNAYYDSSDKGWYSLGDRWRNTSYPFGWEPDADGFRGHVFVSEDNSTVVLSIKGTSLSWLVGDGGPTVKKDKFNDNLLFSCCCARVGPSWYTVCDCYSGGYKCDLSCVQTALTEESLFYNVATNLYNNVTYIYPDASIWVIGHSLGGSISSLLGATFGAPVVAFEAPGEKLAASRLHLPSPPSTHHITHVYHTADPLAMGVCNGVTSACALAGYAMETRCHLGKIIKYDTVAKLNWAVDLRMHSIRKVIETILSEDWEPPSEGNLGRQVPELGDEDDCVDCYNWEFGDYPKRLEGAGL